MSFTNPLLNEDILPEIFKYLATRDRKPARLVCKLWSDVFNYERYTKTEAFFVCNVYDYRTVVEVLSRCRRNSLNLKFDQSHIDENSLPLWKACGKRIESLNFYECTFHLRIVPQIFKLCVNLIEFVLTDGEFVGTKKFHRHPFSVVSVLLPKKKITRAKLTTLNLQSFTVEMKSQDVQCLASAFPSLRTLKMNILLSDCFDFAHINNSSQSPNFAMLLGLFETNLKNVETADIRFPVQQQIGVIYIQLCLVKQHAEFRIKPVPLSLEPFFTVHRNLTEIPYLKYCVSLKVDGTFRAPNSSADLAVIARLIDENPFLERLGMHYLVLENVTAFCTFFSALVKSRVKYVTLGVCSWPDNFTSELDKILEIEDLPINDSVRHLKIYSNTESLSSFCLKYFGNIERLSVKPGDLDLIFKLQPNLKHLSIECDDERSSTPAKSTIESLEILEVRGSVLAFLSGYQFPNLKYFYFLYENNFHPIDDSDDWTEVSETMSTSGESYSSDVVDLFADVFGNEDSDANDEDGSDFYEDEAWDSDELSDAEGRLPAIMQAMILGFHDSDSSDLGSETNILADEKDTLLGFLATDLGEGGEGQPSPQNDSCEQNSESDADTKLFVGQINKIASFLKENAPNLEGFQFTRYSDFVFASEACAAVFKACSNFPKLRYLTVSHMTNILPAAEVKAVMSKYIPLCPLLRAAWFESRKYKIAMYWNTVTNQLEFSDDLFNSAGMLDFNNFYLNER